MEWYHVFTIIAANATVTGALVGLVHKWFSDKMQDHDRHYTALINGLENRVMKKVETLEAVSNGMDERIDKAIEKALLEYERKSLPSLVRAIMRGDK